MCPEVPKLGRLIVFLSQEVARLNICLVVISQSKDKMRLNDVFDGVGCCSLCFGVGLCSRCWLLFYCGSAAVSHSAATSMEMLECVVG